MLSPQLLDLLRDWRPIARSQVWLFPGRDQINPMSTRQFNRAYHAAAHMAEITKALWRSNIRSPLPARTTNQREAAVFNFDKARIFTRMLAGLAAPLTISPVAGLRTRVPALRAGTLRRVTFSKPGKVNSPTPRGCTDPSITLSSVAKTPTAVLRGMSFCSTIRLISAALVKVSLTGRADAASGLVIFGLLTFALAMIALSGLDGFQNAGNAFHQLSKVVNDVSAIAQATVEQFGTREFFSLLWRRVCQRATTGAQSVKMRP